MAVVKGVKNPVKDVKASKWDKLTGHPPAPAFTQGGNAHKIGRH